MFRTLQHKLSVFAQFKSPKSMYREPELYRLYFDLLKHKSPEIQKSALDCLMTYKFKYLQPYKEHLYNLLDEKKFRDELNEFRLDEESKQIEIEHREGLIPVILQIAFSKMVSKTGLRTGGKAQYRRSMILRFLAGCTEHEMLIFTKKAFSIYANYYDSFDNELEMVQSLTVNLEKIIAPKKLISTINLLNVILDQFGGLMGNSLLKYLIKILFIVGGITKEILSSTETVHSGFASILRNIKNGTIKTLERFFEHFDHYPWTTVEIDTVFHTFVWPYLDKLTIEGVHSPTSLLRLIKQWCNNPKYFKLLIVQKDNETVLPTVFQLFVNNKTHITVVNFIYEMIESLLKYQLAENEVAVEPNNVSIISVENLNLGSTILLPHLPSILYKLKTKLEHRPLNQTELNILCEISEFVQDIVVGDSILQLIIPVAQKKSTNEIVSQQLLTIIWNLLKKVENPQKHLDEIIPLIAEYSFTTCRKLLMKILETITNPTLQVAIDLIVELNAFDAKWIDQPDFERRHQAFKNIDSINFNEQTGLLLIYQLFHTLKYEKDLALKDGASNSLQNLTNKVLKQYQHLADKIFRLIKNGLRSETEFRNECLKLLGNLAQNCAETHVTLRDLNKFTNRTDVEVDMFENLTHLQLHRHARAMNKFCQILQNSNENLNSKTISQFLLPLATHYLCSEKYANKNAILDAAIEMVGVLSRIMPWHQYESILKFAMQKLRYKSEYQKQLVRLVVVILDAFHFDLSKGLIEAPQLIEAVIIDEDDPLDINDNLEEEEDNKIVNKITILCKSTSTRVIRTIQNQLLPQLHRSLAQLTNYDSQHKVNRKRTGFEREEEDLSRVPMFLAVVKLLQRLPKSILDHNLPGVFLKVCTFLKSHLESVRRVARETLQNIMITLGPKYLGMLLSEISPLMSRGFQVHVLVFTLHGVLSCLKGSYEPKDIDKVLLTITKLCMADLFGLQSEEKEVAKITVKVSEARSTKSYDTLQIVATNITDSCLMDLILPIKQQLDVSHSFKTVQKARDALRNICIGLVDNEFIAVESLLKIAFGTSSKANIGNIKTKLKKLDKQSVEREDCFIIPKIPGNRQSYRELNVKISTNTNSHVLVEFGLRVCLLLLKRDKVRDQEYLRFLDPFVHIFRDCIKSSEVKLSTLSLQCLQWIIKLDLPSIKTCIKSIVKDILKILHKYASECLNKGDNFDLVMSAFKTIAILVRDVQFYTLNTNHLKILLLYVEQDMHNSERQATAFGLLKAIISRKLIIPEIDEVMKKVAELSITSQLAHVRAQARSVFHQFVMEYPLGNAVEKHLSFYLSQLSFDMQYGRESAIEMVQLMIDTFPLKVLENHSATLLISLGARLVNDEIPECRKMIANCISGMFKRLSDKDQLFEIIILWLKDNDIGHRRLSVQICGLLVAVEKEDFEKRLKTLIPVILKQFGLTSEVPGKFVKLKQNRSTTESEDIQRLKDHHTFQVLQLMLKLCTNCPNFLKQKEIIQNLSYHSQTLLSHPHDWVRFAAAQFLGFVLSSLNVDKLSKLLLENECGVNYLELDPDSCLKSLTLDLCDQLHPDIKQEFAEQVVKNLVFIARVLQVVPNNDHTKINLLWMCRRIRKIINSEIVHNNSSTVLRMELFKWIAGVAVAIQLENLSPVLGHLLAPLVREMVTTDESNAPLRQFAKEVAGCIKKRIGIEEYTEALQKLQKNLMTKRSERKRQRNQLAVTDPESFAQKKIKMHEKKKLAKKRKLDEIRGKKAFKKRKVIDLETVIDNNSEIL